MTGPPTHDTRRRRQRRRRSTYRRQNNTGAAGANGLSRCPADSRNIVTVAYSATAQAVSDLLAAGSTTTDRMSSRRHWLVKQAKT